MKTKFLFILLLFIPVLFTNCNEEDQAEACEELGCVWLLSPGDEEFHCDCD